MILVTTLKWLHVRPFLPMPMPNRFVTDRKCAIYDVSSSSGARHGLPYHVHFLGSSRPRGDNRA